MSYRLKHRQLQRDLFMKLSWAERVERIHQIGYFYEALTAQVLSGERNHNENRSDLPSSLIGDVFVPEASACVEVKACSDTHSFRIFIDQLERYRRNLGFPYDRCWYALWRYHSPDGNAVLRNAQSFEALADYLSKNTQSLWLVDLPVMEELRDFFGNQRIDAQRRVYSRVSFGN